MDAQKVDAFLFNNQKYFPVEKIPYLKEKLLNADESKWMYILSIDYKDPTALLILSLFLGYLGVDRFMLKDIGMGILKLLTFGLCGILLIIDWVIIQKMAKELNYNELMKILY